MVKQGGGGRKVLRSTHSVTRSGAVHVKPDVKEEFGYFENGKKVKAGSVKRPKPPKGNR